MKQLTEAQKTALGKEWAEILRLPKSNLHPDRYDTDWGDKTALGIYEVLNRLVYERHDSVKYLEVSE